MPSQSPKPCKKFGCRALVTDGSYCAEHKKVIQKRADETRKTSSQRGYGYKWQQVSKAFLAAHPLCQCDECKEGDIRLLPAQVVDHIIPHDGDMGLFWDRTNWMAMNKHCHDKKTATRDGGFGRR